MNKFVSEAEMPEVEQMRQDLLLRPDLVSSKSYHFLLSLRNWDLPTYTATQANWIRRIYKESFV
jgi:hypothetical protein